MVAAETIEGGKLFKRGTIRGNTVDLIFEQNPQTIQMTIGLQN